MLIQKSFHRPYIYDRRGNLTETYLNGRITHHHYFGALNRLESVFNYKQNKGAVYDYNGLGHRVGKHIGLPKEPVTAETIYEEIFFNIQTHIEDVIDLTRPFNNLLCRTNADVVRTEGKPIDYDESYTNYTYDFAVLNAQSGDEVLHYYLHDELGSPMRLLNDRGRECNTFNFDEFGIPLRKSHVDQPFSFAGYQVDNDDIAGNLFAQARQYDPNTGRFISEDLIKGNIFEPFTQNHYTYCWNQPMKYVDLDGLFPTDSDGNQPSPSQPPQNITSLPFGPAPEGGITPSEIWNWLTTSNTSTETSLPFGPASPPQQSPGEVWNGVVNAWISFSDSMTQTHNAIRDTVIQANVHYWELSLGADQAIMDGVGEFAVWLGDAWEWLEENLPVVAAVLQIVGGVFTFAIGCIKLIASGFATLTGIGTPLGLKGKVLAWLGLGAGGSNIIRSSLVVILPTHPFTTFAQTL